MSGHNARLAAGDHQSSNTCRIPLWPIMRSGKVWPGLMAEATHPSGGGHPSQHWRPPIGGHQCTASPALCLGWDNAYMIPSIHLLTNKPPCLAASFLATLPARGDFLSPRPSIHLLINKPPCLAASFLTTLTAVLARGDFLSPHPNNFTLTTVRLFYHL